MTLVWGVGIFKSEFWMGITYEIKSSFYFMICKVNSKFYD